MLELLIAIGVNVLIGALAALLLYFSRNSRKQPARLMDPTAAMDLFRRQPDLVPDGAVNEVATPPQVYPVNGTVDRQWVLQ